MQRLKDLPKLLRRVAACLLQLAGMGIVHRDITDENMGFRGEDCNFDELVVFDLGLSREATKSSNTYCGTEEFIAPEIERAGGVKGFKLTSAVDMFSAMITVIRFIVLEELLKKLERDSKTRAYDLDDVRDLLADHQVPEQFISLICSGLTSKPTDRLTALELHTHESLSGTPDPFDRQDLTPFKWVVDLAKTKALNEDLEKKKKSDKKMIDKLKKDNGKGQKLIAKLEVEIDDLRLQSSAPPNGVVEASAAAPAGTGGNDASFRAKVPLLRDSYNGVSKDLTASVAATAAQTGSTPAPLSRSALKNEMLRRLKPFQCITSVDIDRFFCLGNPIPHKHTVDVPFSRENPLPPEIFSEDYIYLEAGGMSDREAQKACAAMGMSQHTKRPRDKLKAIHSGWWDQTDGDEEGTSSETEDDEAAA